MFKYTTSFSSKVSVITPKEYCEKLSIASLDVLRGLFPDSIDVEQNPDLLLNAFNAAVANRVNANDDGIGTKDALNISPRFIHKFTDIEHNRDRIVGHLVSQAFSDFGSNKIVAAESLASTEKPFNISLGAVVYKTVDPDFANMLVESSDESSSRYNSISASWELGFDKYNILLGHRDFTEGELITDPVKVKELSKYLRAYGGEGKTKENEAVYRIIVGGLPLGIGYTTSPAADVEGVVTSPEAQAERETIVLSSTESPVRISSELVKIAEDTKLPVNDVVEAARALAFTEPDLVTLTTRIREAITLSEKSGLSAKEAGESLAASIEAFSTKDFSSTVIATKLTSIESVVELSEAIKRAGVAAREASVSFDEFVNFVSAAQADKGGGGASIGTALRLLFTRVKSLSTLEELIKVGIVVQDEKKNPLSSSTILQNIASKFASLPAAHQTVVTQCLGGAFATAILASIFQNFQKITNSFSQPSTPTVKNNVDMQITNLSQITDELLKNVSSASVIDFIKSELEKSCETYKANVKAKDDELASLAKQVDEFKKQLEAAAKAQKEADEKLNKIQAEQAAAAAESAFNERMSSLNEQFKLSDKDSEVIAKAIRGLDDTAYQAWFDQFSVLASEKKKPEVTVASTAATTADTVAQVLDKVTKTTPTTVPNAGVTGEPTAFQKYQDAFSGDAVVVKSFR